MSKRLELIWPNKDKVLLGLEENGKPIWGTKADLEPRLLVQLEAIGQVNHDNFDDLYEQGDNLLIKGDNLLALKALERHFAAKIKCIYIDPPFNTGNAFEHYDDGLEHTIWLSMMKARLEILNKLLSKDGAIVVHIDYREEARLKLLMDEIFTGGFRNSIIVKRGTKNVQQQFDTIDSLTCGHDTLLLYAASPDTRFPHCRSALEQVQEGTWNNHWRGTDRPTMRYKLFGIKPETGQWRWSEERTMQAVRNYEEYLGKYSNTSSIDDYYSMRLTEDGVKLDFVRLSKTGKPEHYVPPRSFRIVSDVWMDVRTSGKLTELVHEKHEDLLFRVINWLTSPGDWVLDSFLGSGTTSAVAHKLGHKWIGIELGEHAETLCLPRLKRVVNGEDQTGISKQVGWKGGGGFRYCVLGESLFARDGDTGLVMINPKYTNGPLVAAVCNMEDFRLHNDSVFHGVRDSIYAHITEEKVNQAYLDAIFERLPNGKSLIVYCLKRAMNLEIPEEVKIKRIPKELQIPRYLMDKAGGHGE